MKTYEIKSGESYKKKISEGDKDALITQLKSHIFELESNEKDYEALNQKFRQLQNDNALLSEAKLRLEYELKQKEEAYGQQLRQLREEVENLQLDLNEKNSVNKKLYSDKDTLMRELEEKNEELNDLTTKLSELSAQLNKCMESNAGLEKMLQNLNSIKEGQEIQINKLNDDNIKLSQICEQQERDLKKGEQERQVLNQNIDQLKGEIVNLNNNIHENTEQINILHNQLDDSEAANLQLKTNVRDLERQCANLKGENASLKNNLAKEQNCRMEEQKKNINLTGALNDRERELAALHKDYETVKALHMRITEEKNDCQLEIQKLKEHIMMLTNQNVKLLNELQCVHDDDQEILKILAKRDKLDMVIKSNRLSLENSLNVLDEFMNRKKIPMKSEVKKEMYSEEKEQEE